MGSWNLISEVICGPFWSSLLSSFLFLGGRRGDELRHTQRWLLPIDDAFHPVNT